MLEPKPQFDAWNPGLNSQIPQDLLPQVTLYRPDNAETSYRQAREAADLCGRKPQEMARLRLSRLVLHELLIRVTADLHVPDGPNYADFGVNLRGMAARILNGHLASKMSEFEAEFDLFRASVEARARELLEAALDASRPVSTPAPRRSFLARFRGTQSVCRPPSERPEFAALTAWSAELARTDDPFERACLQGLLAIAGGIVGRRGWLAVDRATLIRLASTWVCNSYGSEVVGRMIAPVVAEAAAHLGYRFLPHQSHPFIMNVKGASAAGKSAIRPWQRELVARLGIPWDDFALVSPDYWRKFLIDYESLGKDFKYAAMLTGSELEIIDKKLDRYMHEKALRSEIPHLLIDRFRFDSFEPRADHELGGMPLSRFGHTVYLFFIITPPADTVERAWTRGLETGRYKAVDDLLYHNIEAYTGMPRLFFSWINTSGHNIHFEFLDNSVPLGHRPRTVAFGWNGRITVLDRDCMRRLGTYRHINIDARRPEHVLVENDGHDMLADVVGRVPDVVFVDPQTLCVDGRTENRRCVYRRDGFADGALPPDDTAAQAAGSDGGEALDHAHERKYTIGDWGAVAPLSSPGP